MSADFDLETRASADDHQALRLWLRLLSCTTRVEDQIRQRLRQEFGTTLPRFDLLAQLERHPAGQASTVDVQAARRDEQTRRRNCKNTISRTR